METKNKIKFRGLEENLPKDTELYDYLSNKDESMLRVIPAENIEPTDDFQNFCPAFKHFPKPLLIMPPITLSEGTVKRVIPPLGLAYIGGVLKEKNIDFEILDCVAEGLDTETLISDKVWVYGLDDASIERRIREINPDVVGLSIIYSSDLHMMYRVAEIVKKIDKRIVVIAGGIHCTIYPKEVLNEALIDGQSVIDFIIRGEGEYRLPEFLENLNKGKVDYKADGLCGYREGKVFINHQRKMIEDLDSIPFPAYDKLPMEKYFEFNVPFSPFPRGKRVMQIYTSRGCPVGCTFCSSTNMYKSYRARSPQNVIDEINYWKKQYNIDEIQFADDNLTFSKSRSIEFFSLLKDSNLQWCTPNGIMINTLTEKVLDKMILSGLYQMTVSIDSGSERVLKEEHRKPVNLQKVPDLVNFLKNRGVLIHGTLVVGMPTETIEEIDEGFDYVSDIHLDSIGVFIAQALPGSELYEKTIATTSMTRTAGRTIDTAQALHMISEIPHAVLEEKISDFIYEYNKAMKSRDPGAWNKKYGAHKERLTNITIGHAAPNSDGIIKAIQPTPAETAKVYSQG